MNIIFTEAVLLRGVYQFLIFSSVIGLLAGAVMILRPEWIARLGNYANKWVSTRKLARPLGKSIEVEHWFYRYNRWSGMLLIAAAVYIIYMFTVQLARASLLATFVKMRIIQLALLEPLVDTLVLFFLAGALMALLIGLFLIFRPSMLRDLEDDANQRISVRQTLKPVEIPHDKLDQLVFRHAPLTGVLILGASLYTLVVLVLLMNQ